jgi:hypothetical protein
MVRAGDDAKQRHNTANALSLFPYLISESDLRPSAKSLGIEPVGRAIGDVLATGRGTAHAVIQHPKTNEAVALPLYSADGRPLFPELILRLDGGPKRGALICARDKPDGTGVYRLWSTRSVTGVLATFTQRVRQIRDAAGLPSAITFRSFRHGGFTAAGDVDLSDADTSAVGAKTDATLDIYRKGTMEQRRALTRLLDERSNRNVCPPGRAEPVHLASLEGAKPSLKTLERVKGIEPSSSAWKGVFVALAGRGKAGVFTIEPSFPAPSSTADWQFTLD